MQTVVLAYPYIDAEGKEHEPDASIDLDPGEAARLLFYGLAREPETTKPARSGNTKKKG